MRYCDWDEVLDRDGLLILTEEALTPPRRSRAPMRRLAAAAACAGPSSPAHPRPGRRPALAGDRPVRGGLRRLLVHRAEDLL